MTETTWTDWGRLEQLIPLDDLPRFHREFLKVTRPEGDWDVAPLRQIQGKVQASLKQLEREGQGEDARGHASSGERGHS